MATATKSRKTTRKPISEAEMARRKEARTATAEMMQASLAAQVETLASSDQWKAFLDHAQSFHNYSFNNMMLILAQHPTATRVAGFNQWCEKGRVVKSGEKGIKIYGFSTRKVEDEETGEITRRSYYPIFTVFAEDQTEEFEGDEIRIGARVIKVKHREPATPIKLLEGEDTAQIGQRVINFVQDNGWSFEFEDIMGPANGYTTTDGTKRVVVDVKLSPIMTVKTSLHEAAHMLMHAGLDADKLPEGMTRDQIELEAESVAYVVGGLLGLDTTDYSIGYLTSWSGGNGDAVKATAERVLKTAHTIIEALDPSDTTEEN